MFRLSPIITKTRYARIQPLPHKIFNVSIHQSGALKIYKKVTQRELCPQRPPPPPPPPKSRAWIYKTLLALAATGGIVVYCKNRPEVRDWLSIYAPWFDEFIAIMYQEADTYDQSIKRFFVWTSDTISAYINAPPKPKECMEGGGVLKFLTCKGKNTDNDGKNKRKRKRKEVEKEEEPQEDDHKITGIVECHPPEKTEKVEAAVVVEDVPPPPKTDTLPAVEKCMEETSSTIVEYYDRAKDACLNYQATVVDEIQSYNHNSPEKIRCAMHNRMEIIEDAMEKIQFANKKMKGLFRYMECIKISDEDRQKATKKYYYLVDNQDHAKHMFKIEDEKALVMDQQFDLLSEKLEKFQAEMKIIGNGLDLSKEKLEFNGDPDLLLYHTMRTEKMYRQEMYDLIASNERKIHKGEERMPPQNEEIIKNREMLTKKVTAEKLEEITKDFKRRLDRHKENNEKILKEALRIQTEKQQESFEKRLSQREQELMDSFQRMVAEKVNAEKSNFAEELEVIRKKLRLAEAQLCAQLEKDTEVRKARELYAASASILAAANSGENVTKVNAEIKTIKNVAALDDELTHSVIDALPETVVNDGILPEGILIKQFYDMEKSARQVALVEREGGPLPVFILSWIQSLFLFMKMSGIPSVEAEKPPDPPYTGLDTFDLLQRARYWIANRNLKQAVLYVKELKGASLAVANSWLQHAQTHLEAKQAAEAITAHAAAQTLKHV